MRDWVESRLARKYPIVKALDLAFQKKGLSIFLLLRLSPVVPFNAINYIGGVTSMQFGDYVMALAGILPGTVLYCFVGATAGSLTDDDSKDDAVGGPLAIASLVVGSVLGVLAIFAVSYYARREFDHIVEEEREKRREHGDGFAIDGTERGQP